MPSAFMNSYRGSKESYSILLEQSCKGFFLISSQLFLQHMIYTWYNKELIYQMIVLML